MKKKLQIASIASEVAPFSKTGGLADVSRSLPKAIKRLGHDIIAITPLYGKVIDTKKNGLKLIYENVKVIISQNDTISVNIWQGYLMEELPIYFIENKKYFSKKISLYGSEHENLRFLIFNIAALKLLTLLKFKADIIHCHDWHTGLIPYLLKNEFKDSATLKNSKTIFTIHNLVFQLGHNWWVVPAEKKDYGKSKLPPADDPDIENINFAKRGILTADVINTVSEQYREEIMTKKFGQDLHTILRNRENRLFGIINGIDYNAYNPEKDPLIHKNYSYNKIGFKSVNKKFLQKRLGLPVNQNIPLICATSRVTFQKGFELIMNLLEPLSRLDIQLVILGDGDKHYINELKKFSKIFPKKIIWLPYSGNQELETLLYAGSDIFILPSHHEPCGINQLIAMRYGCIPVVRRVGGLYDTVENYSPITNKGSGFSFNHFDHFSLFASIIRALETYKLKSTWNMLIIRAMKESNSWEIPAKKYINLYKRALKLK
jgi:starch synthase